jgi:uncharacterized protein (TIGR02118 family)
LIKAVIFFRRRPGMSPEAFQEHWRTRHAPLIARLPGIRRYVQNAPLAAAYAGTEPPFDAIAESSFDDTQAMKALAHTPDYAAVLADEPNFIDAASMGSIITEERVIKDGPAAGAKKIRLVARRAQVPVDEFFGRFLEHGAQCAQAAQVRRYVQCHCRRSIYDSGRTPAFDGAAMSWYDDLEALNATGEPEFAEAGRAPLMLASERVVSIP